MSSEKSDSRSLFGLSDRKKSIDDLKEQGYTIGTTLGEGSYSKVKTATYKDKEIAVKVITLAQLSDDFRYKFLPRELEVMRKVRHRNIIQVYKIFEYTDKVYIFMEFCQRGDLLSYVREKRHLEESEARRYFAQMLDALKYLHSHNVAHRDLKCENIMLDDHYEAKLIDFGFCRRTVDEQGRRKLSETFCGSTAYAAPEVLQGEPYNPMMYDVWSLGCILYIMVCGAMPFDDSNVKKMVTYQLKKKIRFTSSFVLSHDLKSLIKHMLEPDVTKRYSMERCNKHAWTIGFNDSKRDFVPRHSRSTE